MTKSEAKILKQWNISISKNEEAASKAYEKIRAKYLKLNGHASCNYGDFLIQIATCDKVTYAEKQADIYRAIKYFEAQGKMEALRDILEIYPKEN